VSLRDFIIGAVCVGLPVSAFLLFSRGGGRHRR
jgi:hypothetical protein